MLAGGFFIGATREALSQKIKPVKTVHSAEYLAQRSKLALINFIRTTLDLQKNHKDSTENSLYSISSFSLLTSYISTFVTIHEPILIYNY